MFKYIQQEEAMQQGYTHLCKFYLFYLYMKYDEDGLPENYMTALNNFSIIVDILYQIEEKINSIIEIFKNENYTYQYSFKIIRELKHDSVQTK